MSGKPNKIMTIRITEQARARLDSVVALLRKRPPVPEMGRATIGSVISAAVIEGLEVLADRYGLNGTADKAQTTPDPAQNAAQPAAPGTEGDRTAAQSGGDGADTGDAGEVE